MRAMLRSLSALSMSSLWSAWILSLLGGLAAPVWAAVNPPPPPVVARAWLLMDVASRHIIASRSSEERIEPASLTKLMSAYLVFAALKSERLRMDQTVRVSANAAAQGGSRMYLAPGGSVTVDELVRGMIVLSGNDATVALAEALAGAEAAFAQMMNREAARLGLNGTHFANATGWPDDQHYSTASDLAALAVALLRDFPERYPLYATKAYRYNGNVQQNRNRLLWLDPHVDGIKTGYTERAGYCVIASARRGEQRMLAVVLGTNSDGARAREAQNLLNHGFQFYDSLRLYEGGRAIGAVRVWKGAEDELGAGVASDLYVTLPRGMAADLKARFVSVQPIVAPVSAGQRVGTLRLVLGDTPYGEYPVVALGDVPAAGFLKRMFDTVRLWFK